LRTRFIYAGLISLGLMAGSAPATADDACRKLVTSALTATAEVAKQGHEVTLVSQTLSTAGGSLKILHQRIDLISRVAPDRVSRRHFSSVGEGGIPFFGIASEDRFIGRSAWSWTFGVGWKKSPDLGEPLLTANWATAMFSSISPKAQAVCAPLSMPGSSAKMVTATFPAASHPNGDAESLVIDVTANRVLSHTTAYKSTEPNIQRIFSLSVRLDPAVRIDAPKVGQ
jgi:hypothetical protein